MWVFFLFAVAGFAGPSTDNFGKPFASKVPTDVRRYVIDRQGCNHFASEPTGDDGERDRFLAQQVEKLCTGIDGRRQKLLARYHDRPDLRPIIMDE